MSNATLYRQTEWGPKLNLEYPTLTSSMPFVLFKLVLLDELENGGGINPGLAPNNQGVLVEQMIKKDSLIRQDKKNNISNDSIFQTEKEKILLYPNPASQEVNIVLPTTKNCYELSIFNSMSQRVVEKIKLTKLRTTIDIHGLDAGVYQVVINGINGVIHFKLVVE